MRCLSGRGSQIAGENYLLPVNLKAKFKSCAAENRHRPSKFKKGSECCIPGEPPGGGPLENNPRVKLSLSAFVPVGNNPPPGLVCVSLPGGAASVGRAGLLSPAR